MGDAAVVSTVLMKSRSERMGKRDTKSLSKVWTDFWLLKSFNSRMSFPEDPRDHKPVAGLSPKRVLSDIADSPRANLSASGAAIDQGPVLFHSQLPMAGEPAVTAYGFDSSNASQLCGIKDEPGCPDEPGVADPSRPGPPPVPTRGHTKGPSANPAESDEKSAFYSLLSGLRERYRGILRRRRDYVNLLSFVFFTVFYAAVLLYQRRAFLAYDIHKSLTYLLPNDGNGGLLTEYQSITDVHSWLAATVEQIWIDRDCGDGVCDDLEPKGYGRFGCPEDCGWRTDLLKVVIQLNYSFVDEDVRDSSLWNICSEGKCSSFSIDPSKSGDFQPCYFWNASGFAHMEGNISATVYLPENERWEFCLLSSSTVLLVDGTIWEVPVFGVEEKARLEQDGYLEMVPVDKSKYELKNDYTRSLQGFLGGQGGKKSTKLASSRLNLRKARAQSMPYISSQRRASVLAASTGSPGVITRNSLVTGIPLPPNMLAWWRMTGDRELSPCQASCLTASVGFYWPCDGILEDGGEGEPLSLPWPPYNASALVKRCEAKLGCDTQPSVALDYFTEHAAYLDINPLLRFLLLEEDGTPVPWFDGSEEDVRALSHKFGRCAKKLGLSSYYGEVGDTEAGTSDGDEDEVQAECTPGCPVTWLADQICDEECFVEECQSDLTDCCGKFDINGEKRILCPDKPGERHLFQKSFTVLSDIPTVSIAVPDDAAGESPALSESSSSTTLHSRWRTAGVTNRIVGGMVIKQHRTPRQNAPADKKFQTLFNLGFATGANATAFGANPYFAKESALYNPELFAHKKEYFEDLAEKAIPPGFQPLYYRGRDIFPFFIDIGKSQSEALTWVEYLREGAFLDIATEEVEVEVVTYNGILEYFGMLLVQFRRLPGGVISISSDIQMFSLDMYNTPGERVRAAVEVALLIMVLAGTFSEMQQIVTCVAKTGSLHRYFASIANIIDLISISLYYVCIALWVRFLVKYHGRFDIALTYQPYRTTFASEGERLAKMLEFTNNGTEMRHLLDKFEEVQGISRVTDVYFFLTSLNLLLMTLRVLKLTDFHPRLGIVTHTLSRAFTDIMHYLLVAGVVFISFSTMAHISFGTILAEFSTLSDAFNTCFLMLVGEVGINEKLMDMKGLQLGMGWIFFWLFMIIMNLIMINFFIAFVIDSFSEHMSGGARSSSTVAQDIRNVFRDTARHLWALLCCKGGRAGAQTDASIAAKLDALLSLTTAAATNTTTASAAGTITRAHTAMHGHKGIESSGGYGNPLQISNDDGGKSQPSAMSCELSLFPVDSVPGTGIPLDANINGGQVRDLGTGGVSNRASLTEQVEEEEEGGHFVEHAGKAGREVGVDEPAHSTMDLAAKAAAPKSKKASTLASLCLPRALRPHLRAERALQEPGTRQVVIDGVPFTEEDIATHLLDGMQSATLAGGATDGTRGMGLQGGERRLVARSRQTRAQKVLFGSRAAGGTQGAGAAPLAGSLGKLCGRKGSEEELDLEGSLHVKDMGRSSPGSVTRASRDGVSAADCHDAVRDISSHAIWRFGTACVDDTPDDDDSTAPYELEESLDGSTAGLSLRVSQRFRAPQEPSKPENPVLQLAQMVVGLEGELVEMQAQYKSSQAHLAASLAEMEMRLATSQAQLTSALVEMESRWSTLFSQLLPPVTASQGSQPGVANQQH